MVISEGVWSHQKKCRAVQYLQCIKTHRQKQSPVADESTHVTIFVWATIIKQSISLRKTKHTTLCTSSKNWGLHAKLGLNYQDSCLVCWRLEEVQKMNCPPRQKSGSESSFVWSWGHECDSVRERLRKSLVLDVKGNFYNKRTSRQIHFEDEDTCHWCLQHAYPGTLYGRRGFACHGQSIKSRRGTYSWMYRYKPVLNEWSTSRDRVLVQINTYR